MKKTISINLSGLVFYIEEEGYEMLKNYLDNIRNQFVDQEEADMILEDVEIRIAELFTLKLSESKTAVTTTDVQEVMDQMGEASSYGYDDGDESSSEKKVEKEESSNDKTEKKKLFRDSANGNIAGVAEGLAKYFNIDVAIVRIVFVLVTLFGPGLLIYIILWIVLPDANGTSDRLKMKGKPITVENIKEEAKNAGEKLSASSKKFAKNFSENTESTIGKIANALGKLFGIGFVLFSITMLVLLLIFTVGQFGIVGTNQYAEILSLFDLSEIIFETSNNFYFAWTGIYLTTIIPLIALFLFGTILLFKVRSKATKRAFFFLFTLFITGVIICFVVGSKTGVEFGSDAESEEFIGHTAANELEIKFKDDAIHELMDDGYIKYDRDNIILLDEENISLPIHRIKIQYTTDSLIRVKIIKSAHGETSISATDKLENISLDAKFEGNKLIMSPYFSFPKEDKLRAQDIRMTVLLPYGSKISKINKDGSKSYFDTEPAQKNIELTD